MLKTGLNIEDFRADQWNRCLRGPPQRLPESLPMMRWEWFYCFESTQPKTPLFEPAHAAWFIEQTPVVIAPMYIKRTAEFEWTLSLIYELIAKELGRGVEKRHVGLIPFTPIPGYEILVHPEFNPENVLPPFFQSLKAHFQGQRTFLQFQMLTTGENNVCKKALLAEGFLQENSFTYQWQNRGYKTFHDFLKSLPYKKRNKIQREMKALAQDHIAIRIKAAADITLEDMQAFHRAYEANVEKHYAKSGYLTAEFFGSLYQHFREFLQINCPEKDGEVLGLALFLKSHTALFGRWWGAFRDIPFLHFNTCYYTAVNQAIQEGKHYIDPGFQGVFKKRRGFDRVAVESFIYAPDPHLQELTRLVLSRFKPADYY